MKRILLITILFAVQVNAQILGKRNPESVTRVLDQGGGAKVVLLMTPGNPSMHVIRDSHRVTISYADGTETKFLPYRLTSWNHIVARLDPRNHRTVALTVAGDLLIHSKDEDKASNIKILRNDLITPKPKIDGFRIFDMVWHKDQLVCIGNFRVKNSGYNDFDFPFISRMDVNEKGIPSNHQILWTTWHPKADPQRTPDSLIHQAGTPLTNSLIPHGDQVIWRNEGNWQSFDFPVGDNLFLQHSSWITTDLRSGKTENWVLSDDKNLDAPIHRNGNLLLKHFEDELGSARSNHIKQKLEYLIRRLLDEGHTKEAQ